MVKWTKKLRVVALLAVLALGSAAIIYAASRPRSPEVIELSGNIETTDVEIGFKVPGRIAARFVSEGESVSSGQPVAQLDTQELEQEVAMRRSEVLAVQARLAELEAGSRPEDIAEARAGVDRAEAQLAEMRSGSREQEIKAARAVLERVMAEEERTQKDFERMQELHAKNAVARRELDHASAAFATAEASVAEAREQLHLKEEGPREEKKAEARAALAGAQAAYDKVVQGPRKETIDQARAEAQRAVESQGLAETRLSYTMVYSPLGGVVLAEHAEPGEYIVPGAPVVTVGDMDNVWLRGYINETDLGRVRHGQSAVVTTDSYPGKSYHGAVAFIASQAEFTPKHVQTDKERVKLVYRVKISLPNPNHELKPGMPADATILLSPDTEQP